jgi:YkoY family integral membrane protein
MAGMIARMFDWADVFTIVVLIGLEGLLSADNAMVMAVMVLGLPVRQHHKALQYGLVGAFIFRFFTTIAAFWLIRLAFAKVIGGLYLLYLPYQHFWGSGESTEKRRTPPTARAWLGLSPFWATVVKVELMNLVFSIDSILAAVAMSPKMWVVLAGGILGLVAMRIVVGRLLVIIQKYPAIVDGAFIIIAWVGSKLLIEYLHAEGLSPVEVPQWFSVSLIVTIFGASFLYARREAAHSHVRHLEGITPEDTAEVFSDTDA